MSEFSPGRSIDTFNSITVGSITLLYNEELLDSFKTTPLKEMELPKEQLAAPTFPKNTNGHIKAAEFELARLGVNESVAIGSITYDVARTNPHRRYLGFNHILNEVHEYLDSQHMFNNFNLFLDSDGINAAGDVYTYRFSASHASNAASEITLTIQAQYNSVRPSPQEILDAASAWAHVCDYVVSLGVESHETTPDDLRTTIVLGNLKEYPSDIEIALVQELEHQRRKYGAAATLPYFDDTDILSLDNQSIITAEHITTDELVEIAKGVIDNKYMIYATLDVMTSISQSDIINAIKKALDKRIKY